MKKHRYNWIKPLIGFLCAIIFAIALGMVDYDGYVKHPENSASPTGSGRLFNLLFYFIDKHLGKTGVFIFLGLTALFFLYHLIKAIKSQS
jgi:hypothetical protein